MFTPNLSKYPDHVLDRTRRIGSDSWMAYASMTWGHVDIYYHEMTGYGFYHEMGHAAAHLLGIENELGHLVMSQPNAKNPKNDNIFCYGAQRLEVHQYQTAIAEYAAVAIEYFVTEPEALPVPVREFVQLHWI